VEDGQGRLPVFSG